MTDLVHIWWGEKEGLALRATAAASVPPNLVLASLEGIPSELGGTSLQVGRENPSLMVPPQCLGGTSLRGGLEVRPSEVALEGHPSEMAWRDVPPRWLGGIPLWWLEGKFLQLLRF